MSTQDSVGLDTNNGATTNSRSGGCNGKRLGTTVMALAVTVGLAGCAGLTPGGASPSNAGAPQPATNLAQTARDQAAVPGQAYGGHNYWNFASSGQVAVQEKVLALAATNNWTPDQIITGLAATNGSPEVVTITVGGNVEGGAADNAGAGTGGSGALSGSGTLQPR